MSNPNEPKILRRAEFNRQVRIYWLLSGILLLTLTIVGIPLLLLWIPLGLLITERYLQRLECVLTEKSLKVSKGLLVRVEKTVPLDKITDLGLVQGPLMRYLGLHALSIETAGQSAQGALVRMVGIQDTRSFRDAVLEQRERVVAAQSDRVAAQSDRVAAQSDRVAAQSSDSASPATTSAAPLTATPGVTDQLLGEIRDTLQRIEQAVGK